MFVLGSPSDARLGRILDDVRDTPLTYPEVGATLDGGALPQGYHHVRARRPLGAGDVTWSAVCDAIRAWQLHRGQGFRVFPAHPPVAVGVEVVTIVALAGPVHVLAACRVVATVEEATRFGFAYGTLAVHPARGEEAFVVERDPSGRITATVTAFSRPRHPLVRLGGPVARRQQTRATDGYLDALAEHVRTVA